MFDKFKQLGELNKMRKQAMAIQKKLAQEVIEVNENGVRVIISGDQKIQSLDIDGVQNSRVAEAVNMAVKKSQKMAARKLQEMSGGLTGMLKGMGGGS